MGAMKLGRLILLTLGIVVIFPLGCGKDVTKKSVPGPNDKVYTVGLAKAVQRQVPDSIHLDGVFIPVTRMQLKSDFTGRVQALSVSEGQNVLSGDVLLKVEDEKLPWVLERQRAELREAEAQMELDNRLGVGGAPADGFDEGDGGYDEEEQLDIAGEFEENLNDNEQDNFGEEPFNEEPPLDAEADNVGEEGFEEGPVEGETPFARLARLRARARQARLAARARQRQNARPNPAAATAGESREVTESRATLNQAKVDRIRAEVALTEKQLEGSTLNSAIDGFVTKLYVTEGSLVKPQDPLLDIVTIDSIELSLKVPKEEIGKVDKNMEAKIAVPALGGKILNGEISFIGAELDPDQKTVEIRIRVNNPDQKVKIGMQGVADLAIKGASHKAVLVPAQAIVSENQKSYVYLQEGQVAERVEVQTGAGLEGWVEVKGGLKEGDNVVLQGVDQLKGSQEFIKTRS